MIVIPGHNVSEKEVWVSGWLQNAWSDNLERWFAQISYDRIKKREIYDVSMRIVYLELPLCTAWTQSVEDLFSHIFRTLWWRQEVIRSLNRSTSAWAVMECYQWKWGGMIHAITRTVTAIVPARLLCLAFFFVQRSSKAIWTFLAYLLHIVMVEAIPCRNANYVDNCEVVYGFGETTLMFLTMSHFNFVSHFAILILVVPN